MSPLITQFGPFVLIFIVFYFLLIRPQQKRQRTRQSMLSAVKVNDKIVTIGGLHGTVTALDDATVTIKVGDNQKLVFERSAISSVKQVAAEEA